MLIAIDGPAASGKGTIARKIAAKLKLDYLDTGKLYRGVAFKLHQDIGDDLSIIKKEGLEQVAIEHAKEIRLRDLDNPELENEEIGNIASIVSAIAEVREELINIQKRVAKSESGAVLDGRDIGTMICPDADYKFFITATPEVRASRRYKQLQSRKKDVIEAQILQDILNRDQRDSNRSIAPLEKSEDAVYIDTTNLSIEEVFQKIMNIVEG